MKIFTSILVGLSLAASVFGQALPPVLRNGLTTNTFLPVPGSIPSGSAIIWDAVNLRFTNGIASANATNAISNSVGDGTNTSFWVSGPGYAVRISGPILAGTNGDITFGSSVNFSFFTNWNSTVQQGSWRMNVPGQGTYIQDGAFVSVENGSVILVGVNTGTGVTPSSVRFGSNDYLAFTEADNNEFYRYRGRSDITGNVTNWMMRYWEMSNYVASFLTNTTGSGATFVLQGAPTLSNTVTFVGTVGVQQPQIRLNNTVGNGYLSFSQPGGWIPTNNISFKFTNVQAGQIVGIASAVISSGIAQIDLTNVNASAGGGAGLSTNANQFLGDPLAIKDSALLSNIFNYGAITLPTAGKFHMFAGVVSNGWYNVSSVANQTIGHLNGTNQYYRVTLTSNTNLVLTNIQDNIWYTVELTNSGAFTATIFPIQTANWVQHPFSSPVITQNGVTLWRFMKTGTSTNAYEDGAQLELAKGPGIQFATNGSGILTISAVGAASQFSPASANGDPLVVVSNAFFTNVTLFGMTVLDQNGVGDYGFDINAIGRFYLVQGGNNVLIYDVTRGLYAPAGYGNTNGYKDFPWFKSFNVDVFAASNVFAQFVWPTNVGASQLVRTDSGGKLAAVTIGSGITFDGTTISSSGGTGGTNFGGIIVTNSIERGTTNAGSATALTIDWKGPMYWHGTPSGNLTLSFANTPSAGDKGKTMFVAIYTNTSFTVTWPSSVDWRGINPVTVSGITNLYVLDFDGTNLYGFSMQNNTTGSNQVYALQAGPTFSNAVTIAGQLLYTAENFNGSNGVTATALTNIWDMTTTVFKPVTNFVGTNLCFILSNPAPTKTIVSAMTGNGGYSNIVWITAVPTVNIKWMGYDTNATAHSGGILIRPNYYYWIVAQADRSTNVSVWVTTDDPLGNWTGFMVQNTNIAAQPNVSFWPGANITIQTTNNTASNRIDYVFASTASGGAQTPWTSDISAADFGLYGADFLVLSNADGIMSLVYTNGLVLLNQTNISGASYLGSLVISNNFTAPTNTVQESGLSFDGSAYATGANFGAQRVRGGLRFIPSAAAGTVSGTWVLQTRTNNGAGPITNVTITPTAWQIGNPTVNSGTTLKIANSTTLTGSGGRYLFGGGVDFSGPLNPASANSQILLGDSIPFPSLTASNVFLRTSLFATNGLATYTSNKLAVTSITVTASPFNWTNNVGINVFAFVNGGTESDVSINGSTVFAGTLGGGQFVPLQPGEWTTITYSIAPTMTWKPY